MQATDPTRGPFFYICPKCFARRDDKGSDDSRYSWRCPKCDLEPVVKDAAGNIVRKPLDVGGSGA